MIDGMSESEIADRYRRFARRFTDIVEAVETGAWDRPSPCEGWSARDVLAHVTRSELDHLDRVGLTPDPPLTSDDPVTAWPSVRDHVQAALDDPATASKGYEGLFGPSTLAASIDQFYTPDLMVHGWDIARATGLADMEAMPAEDVERYHAALHSLGDAIRQPGAFGPEVPVAEDASPQDRFLAFLGRLP
jgi:uncharacterized protein (TIGR03086 family)